MLNLSEHIERDIWLEYQILAKAKRIVRYSPKGYLTHIKKGNAVRFRHIFYEETPSGKIRKCNYLSREDGDLYERLKQKRIEQERIKVIRSNLGILENTSKEFQSYDDESILARLPESYRLRPQTDAGRIADEPSKHHKAADRIFIPALEERLITMSGLAVKSKSELIIANMLDFYKIPFIYEEPTDFCYKTYDTDGCPVFKHLRPDFSFHTEGGERLYWEHFGLLDKDDYLETAKLKLRTYTENGLVLFRDVLFTSDVAGGGIDSRSVTEIIENILIPRLFPHRKRSRQAR